MSFRYRPDKDPTGEPQVGLIAEEVAEVMPELVVYGEDGKPETVRYHLLDAMLLNELQKQHRTQETLLVEIEQQRHDLDRQQQRLAEVSDTNSDLRTQNAALLERLDRIEDSVRAITGRQGAASAVSCDSGL